MNHHIISSEQLRSGSWPKEAVSINCEHLAVGEQIERATNELPDGRGVAMVELFDQQGNLIVVPTNHRSLSEEICAAIVFAQQRSAITPLGIVRSDGDIA